MKNKHNRTGGFTIIEVVLVLAVAGLIFLVVFAAIPRLQASRRDNQRKRDMEQLATLVIEYYSNTGSLPANTTNGVGAAFPAPPTAPAGSFYTGYIQDNGFSSPSGGSYVRAPGGDPATDVFYYEDAAVCATGNSSITGTGAGNDDFAILIGLERGEYCVDTR